MPPRLSHKKTRTGCVRCKARKVKCDEEKPKCGACTRHGVHCEYPPSPYADHRSPSSNGAGMSNSDQLLELRLLHEWMAYTCMSLSTTWEFWKYQAPLLAFEFRHVLDALLALTALYSSRQKPRYWSPMEGKMLSLEEGESASSTPLPDPALLGWKSANKTSAALAAAGEGGPETLVARRTESHSEMLEISRRYFAAALEGHQRAVTNITVHNARATYMSSILVCYYSLFTLSEGSDDPDSLMLDPMKWFRLSKGTVIIIEKWKELVGERWFLEAGAMYGEPDLSDSEELFRPEHYEPFKYLLIPVGDDVIAHEDREAYEHTLSYIGLMYKGIVHGYDSALATGRRVIAMPARVPVRFVDLVEANQPRAIAILAHAFAAMKLAELRFPWFKGIANRQVPIVCMSLPPSWGEMVQWPLQIIREEHPWPS